MKLSHRSKARGYLIHALKYTRGRLIVSETDLRDYISKKIVGGGGDVIIYLNDVLNKLIRENHISLSDVKNIKTADGIFRFNDSI